MKTYFNIPITYSEMKHSPLMYRKLIETKLKLFIFGYKFRVRNPIL